ncbi:MAG: serine/threonine protein kinase, partial [Alphaproteobacteria bacterium]|nr:serine/threonine protein kinase [Alphaproteobacteria bacterium]MCL2717142.1 serine/threonine protein kinase [Alphaproteobacteria bacterium]
LIPPLVTSDHDRAVLRDIVDARKNLRDRFNFEAQMPDPAG